MKSTNLFFIGALLMLLCSCSEKNQILDDPTSGRADITFVTQVGKAVAASSRGSADKTLDTKQFALYAFKKSTTGEKYSFQEVAEKGNEIAGNKLEYKASIPVGIYKFIAFYNLDTANREQITTTIEGLKDLEWSAILQEIVIKHQADNNVTTEDMNEIFYTAEDKETSISSGTEEGKNDININLELKRLTSRIDVKFIKVATDKVTEVPYDGETCIFGAKGDLQSLELNLSGSAKSYVLSGTNDNTTTIACNKLYDVLTSLLNYGKATTAEVTNPAFSPFPKDVTDINAENMIDCLEKGISNGGAYFMGSYLLPISTKLSGTITLNGNDGAKRTLKVENIESKKNFVTVITIKLQSSTAPGGDGDPGENLFNPKVKFTVTVDYKYEGINNDNNVDVE